MPAPTAKVLKKKTVMLSMAVFFSYWNRRSRIEKLSAIPDKRCEAERPYHLLDIEIVKQFKWSFIFSYKNTQRGRYKLHPFANRFAYHRKSNIDKAWLYLRNKIYSSDCRIPFRGNPRSIPTPSRDWESPQLWQITM